VFVDMIAGCYHTFVVDRTAAAVDIDPVYKAVVADADNLVDKVLVVDSVVDKALVDKNLLVVHMIPVIADKDLVGCMVDKAVDLDMSKTSDKTDPVQDLAAADFAWAAIIY